MLERGGRDISLTDWAEELIDACRPLAACLDAAMNTPSTVPGERSEST